MVLSSLLISLPIGPHDGGELTSTRMFWFCSPPPQPKQFSSSLCARVPPPSSSNNNRDIAVETATLLPHRQRCNPAAGRDLPAPRLCLYPTCLSIMEARLCCVCRPGCPSSAECGTTTEMLSTTRAALAAPTRCTARHGPSAATPPLATVAKASCRVRRPPVPRVSVVWAAGEAMRGCMTYIEHEALFVLCAWSVRQSPLYWPSRR